MGKPTSLVARKRVWYFRKRYPKDVAALLGRVEYVQSLHTGYYTVALERHAEEMLSFTAKVVSARSALPHHEAKIEQSTDDSLAKAYRLVQDYIADRRHQRAAGQSLSKVQMVLNGVPDDRVFEVETELDADLVDLLQDENDNGRQRVFLVSKEIAARNDERFVPGSEFASILYEQVRKALIELADEERATFLDRPPLPGHRQFSNQPTPSITFKAAAAKFKSDLLDAVAITERTRRKQQATLSFLERHFGADTALSDISRQDAFEFRDLLSTAPTNATKLFGELPLRELVQKSGSKGYRVMKHATQTTYLEMAERLFEWAVMEDHLLKNPMAGLTAKAQKVAPEDQRDPYTLEELERIFNAPIYTGCKDDERGFSQPGPNIVKRSRYWLPLIALFTGMRAEEILQLSPDHIDWTPKGIPFFTLTRDMRLKNRQSRREIPMHPTLIAAGFLDFVEKKRSARATLLFDDVPLGKDGTRSSVWSKRYATFSLSVGAKDDLNCFHSFRHTFKAAADAADIPEEYKDKLQGWAGTSKSTGRRYGTGFNADQLASWIVKIRFDGLDLAHLDTGAP